MKFSHISIACSFICVILIGTGLYYMNKDDKASKTDNNASSKENTSEPKKNPSSNSKENITESKEKPSSENQPSNDKTKDLKENLSFNSKENITESKENLSSENQQNSDPSNNILLEKIIIPVDSRYDTLINDKVNQQDLFKDKKLFRALIYCAKAINFIDRSLLKMINIPNPDKDNPNKMIKISKEKIEILYNRIKAFRKAYVSSNNSLMEDRVNNEISYIEIYLSKLDQTSRLKSPKINPKELVVSNLHLKNLLIEAISKAFPKDVQTDIFNKRFRYESVDYEFDILDVYAIEGLSYFFAELDN